ncbi:MAG TPA: molybdenum cofactor guanylyltransferase [Verrucomicrobiae bacterium]|nr:molybdenum cofactor guanylyltransferase [Verrucomicrobiae bacterium]
MESLPGKRLVWMLFEGHLSSAPVRTSRRTNLDCEIFILAGGLSRRMGIDKARLRLGRRTMLSQVRFMAKATGLPVRIICRDIVPRCGPLGGIITSFKKSRARAILFLACDMPFVTEELLWWVVNRSLRRGPREIYRPSFVTHDGQTGFPFVLPRAVLPEIEARRASGKWSLEGLAATLNARQLRIPKKWISQLDNINTPEEFLAKALTVS